MNPEHPLKVTFLPDLAPDVRAVLEAHLSDYQEFYKDYLEGDLVPDATAEELADSKTFAAERATIGVISHHGMAFFAQVPASLQDEILEQHAYIIATRADQSPPAQWTQAELAALSAPDMLARYETLPDDLKAAVKAATLGRVTFMPDLHPEVLALLHLHFRHYAAIYDQIFSDDSLDNPTETDHELCAAERATTSVIAWYGAGVNGHIPPLLVEDVAEQRELIEQYG